MCGNGFLFCLAAAASYPLGAFVLTAQQLHGLGNKQAFLLGFNHVKRLQQLQRSLHDVRICASDSTENLRCAIDAAILEQLALSLNRFEHQLEIENQDAVPIGNACDDADAVIFKEVFFQANPVIHNTARPAAGCKAAFRPAAGLCPWHSMNVKICHQFLCQTH